MRKYTGKCVFGGIAIGRISVYKKGIQQIKPVKIDNFRQELACFHQAKEVACLELQKLYQKALEEVGEADAAIFEVHRMLLEDEAYTEAVEKQICTGQVSAAYAVSSAGTQFANMFASMEDACMQARAADVKDITERLLLILTGRQTEAVQYTEPVILVAEDLTPSETIQLDKEKILSFVTVQGSANSHTAILARTMCIPALVGTALPLDGSVDDKLGIVESMDGKLGIVDAMEGVLYVEPDEETLALMLEKQQLNREKQALLQDLKGRETMTLDGQKIALYANIGNVKDLDLVLENDAGGIGLFRSEFIYLERESLPTEEEQFQIYKTVAETMAGKKVIIRTLDIGADKQCDYFALDMEENPALGYRAIRISLTYPEIFKTQLRALLRASVYGDIAILYPMIISVEEVRRIQEIVDTVRAELSAEGIAYGNPAQGIMIETPAAVMISQELAQEVDFFSIGTNDLTQYTLAIDRQNPKLEAFYNPHHPAVMKMIAMVVENAHKAGIPVGICGELGADTALIGTFLKMGVDELSVAPGSVLPVRKCILEMNVAENTKSKFKS